MFRFNWVFLITVIIARAFLFAPHALAQSDDAPPERLESKNTLSNAFSKIFSRTSNDPKTSEPNTPRASGAPTKPANEPIRKRQVQATETGNRGGLFVPIRSFTNRVFRTGQEDSSDQIQIESPKIETSYSNDSAPKGPIESTNRRTVEPFSTPAQIVPAPTSSTNSNQSGNRSIAATQSGQVNLYLGATTISPQPSPKTTTPISDSKRQTAPNPPSLEEKSTSRRNTLGSLDERPVSEANIISKPATKPSTLLELSLDSHSESSSSRRTTESQTPTSADTFSKKETSATVSPRPKVPANLPDRSARQESDEPSVSIKKSGLSESRQPQQKSNDASNALNFPTPPARSERDSIDTGARLLEMNQPGIRVYVQGPNAIVVGNESIYDIIVKNEGNFDVQGLVIRVSLPKSIMIGRPITNVGTVQPDQEEGENAILWDLEKLSAAEQQALRVPIQTQAPDPFTMGVEWTTIPQSRELSIKVQQPKLDIALEGPAEAEFGTPVNYRVRITNPGNAIAKGIDVVVSAETFGSNQSNIGDILPGKERVIDVELLFQQGGVIPIVASASSSASKLHATSKIDVSVKQAKLVAKWEGPSSYYQGSVADYKLVVTNTGDSTVQQSKCTVQLPPGAETLALPAGATRRGSLVQWEIKKLQPNETLNFPIRLTFNQLGQFELAFQSETKNSEEFKATYPIFVDAVEDLKLTVVAPIAPAPVGQPVIYDIEIHNRGNKAAENVGVLAQFSDGIDPTRFEGHTGFIQNGQVIFDPINSIAPNEKRSIRVYALAARGGVHRFRAEVKCAKGDSDLVQEGSTRYLATGAVPNERR